MVTLTWHAFKCNVHKHQQRYIIFLSVCLSVCLFVCLSVCLPVCLSLTILEPEITKSLFSTPAASALRKIARETEKVSPSNASSRGLTTIRGASAGVSNKAIALHSCKYQPVVSRLFAGSLPSTQTNSEEMSKISAKVIVHSVSDWKNHYRLSKIVI